MPTTYRLLPRQIWESLLEGYPFEVGGRTNWKLTLTVSRMIVPGNVIVVVETSPTGDENTWKTLTTFEELVDVGQKTVTSGTNVFAINPLADVLIRARITAISGRMIGEVIAEAPFLDPKDENSVTELFSPEFRSNPEKESIIREAEGDVLRLLNYDVQTGELDIDLTLPEAQDAIRRAIAMQAEHIRIRRLAGRSTDVRTRVKIARYVTGLSEILNDWRPPRSRGWFGQ